MKNLINALDDGETWGGLGTVFSVPDRYAEPLNSSDDLMLPVPTKHDRTHVSEIPSVKAYGVTELYRLYRYLVKHPPRDAKARALVARVELK